MLHSMNYKMLFRAICVFLALAMIFGPIRGSVAAQEIPQIEPEPRVYLVSISPPDFHNLEVPQFKNMEEAGKFSAKIMMGRVTQLYGELSNLKDAGLIQNFELVNNGQYYRIEGVDPIAFPMIERLDIVETIIDDTGAEPACLTSMAKPCRIACGI